MQRCIRISVVLVGLGLSGCYGLFDPRPVPFPDIPPPPVDARLTSFRLDSFQTRLRRGNPVGEFPFSLFCYRMFGHVPREMIDGLFSFEQANAVFYDTMLNAGFDVAGDPRRLFDAGDERLRAELLIQADVVDLYMVLCDTRLFFGNFYEGMRGEADIRINWTVYSRLHRQILYRTTTSGRATVAQGQFEGDFLLAELALASAIERLAGDEGFRNVVFNTPDYIGPGLIPPGARPPILAPGYESAELFGTIRIAGRRVRRADLERSARWVRAATVSIGDRSAGFGSGFFIGEAPDGGSWLLTNNHVVGDAERVRIRLQERRALLGHVVRRDPRRDVALVKVEGRAPSILAIRRRRLDLSETVFAIGTPIREGLRGTITRGSVSGFRRALDTGLPVIQSDVLVYSGNSGGPLLDSTGNVVGITAAVVMDGRTGLPRYGLNLFIPILDALDRLNVEIVPVGE